MFLQILRKCYYFSYNGYLPAGERGRRRSKFVLYRRPSANGVRRSKHYVVKTPHSSKAILDASQHSISYTLSRSQAVIVEYTEDPDTDMFQVCHTILIFQIPQYKPSRKSNYLGLMAVACFVPIYSVTFKKNILGPA